MVKMNEDKASMYIVAIVGVVAAVGIIILLMGTAVSLSSDDLSGQAYDAKALENKVKTRVDSYKKEAAEKEKEDKDDDKKEDEESEDDDDDKDTDDDSGFQDSPDSGCKKGELC